MTGTPEMSYTMCTSNFGKGKLTAAFSILVYGHKKLEIEIRFPRIVVKPMMAIGFAIIMHLMVSFFAHDITFLKPHPHKTVLDRA